MNFLRTYLNNMVILKFRFLHLVLSISVGSRYRTRFKPVRIIISHVLHSITYGFSTIIHLCNFTYFLCAGTAERQICGGFEADQ
jgi:hypothetical protein